MHKLQEHTKEVLITCESSGHSQFMINYVVNVIPQIFTVESWAAFLGNNYHSLLSLHSCRTKQYGMDDNKKSYLYSTLCFVKYFNAI